MAAPSPQLPQRQTTQPLCSYKQAWQMSTLIWAPLFFNQLGNLLSESEQPHPYMHFLTYYVTLPSILQNSPVYIWILQSRQFDLYVLLFKAFMWYLTASKGGLAVLPTMEGRAWFLKLLFHILVFHVAFFNIRKSSAVTCAVFMLLADIARAKAADVEKQSLKQTKEEVPLCTPIVRTVWLALVLGTTDVAFMFPMLGSFKFRNVIGVAGSFLLFPVLLIVSYMMDTVYRNVLHFTFSPATIVVSRYFTSDVLLTQCFTFIIHLILVAVLS